MPDLPKSAGNTWKFDQNLAGCKPPSVDLDVTDDYLIFDNQVEVDYTREEKTLGVDGKMTTTAKATRHLCHVRIYVVNFRDLLQEAMGHLKVGDMRAEISVQELDGIEPRTGDKLVAPSGTYFVFGIDFDHTAQMYIVWSRK